MLNSKILWPGIKRAIENRNCPTDLIYQFDKTTDTLYLIRSQSNNKTSVNITNFIVEADYRGLADAALAALIDLYPPAIWPRMK